MQTSLSRALSLVPTLLAALAIVAPVSARAAGPLVEEETKTQFQPTQTLGGTTYQCVATGLRSVRFLGFIPVKVYAAAYCVEADGVKAISAAAAGKPADKLAEDQGFFNTALQAPGGKLVIEHFVRSVDKEKIAEAFKESLGKVLPPEKVQKLTGLITVGPKEGEEVKIYSQGNTLTVDVAGTSNKIEDAEIVQKLWLVFLGPESVTPSMKKSLAQRAASGL